MLPFDASKGRSLRVVGWLRAVEGCDDLIGVGRFRQVAGCTQLDALHRRGDTPVARQHDHDRGRIQGLELAYNSQPGLARKPQVDKCELWAFVTCSVQSRGMIGDPGRFISAIAHRPNQAFTKRGIVVDD